MWVVRMKISTQWMNHRRAKKPTSISTATHQDHKIVCQKRLIVTLVNHNNHFFLFIFLSVLSYNFMGGTRYTWCGTKVKALCYWIGSYTHCMYTCNSSPFKFLTVNLFLVWGSKNQCWFTCPKRLKVILQSICYTICKVRSQALFMLGCFSWMSILPSL